MEQDLSLTQVDLQNKKGYQSRWNIFELQNSKGGTKAQWSPYPKKCREATLKGSRNPPKPSLTHSTYKLQTVYNSIFLSSLTILIPQKHKANDKTFTCSSFTIN